LSSTLEVGLAGYKAVGWVCGLLFSAGSIAAAVAHQYLASAGLLPFALLGAYIIVAAGSFTFTELDVIHTTWFGRYRIAWTQVRTVEVGNGGSMVLHGDDKRFVLAPTAYWSGKDKSAALALLKRKFESLALSTYRTNIGDYKTHKNVRA